MLSIVVCVSGGGTNLQAIIDGIHSGAIRDTRIAGVISNNAGAYALVRAEENALPAFCISPKSFEDRAAFNRAFMDKLSELSPDLIVLAGFLVILPPEMTKVYAGRIINIHPSLIPSFCGKGFYGLRVHEEALKRGVKITGATVHIEDEGTDTGTILYQKAVEVLPGDTPEILQKRVMEQAEWIILPKAIDEIAQQCGNTAVLQKGCGS